MQIKNSSPSSLAQPPLQPSPANIALQKAREEHLQNMGDTFLNKIKPAAVREFIFRHIAQRLSQLPLSATPQADPKNLVQMGVELQKQGYSASDIRQRIADGFNDSLKQLESAHLPPRNRASIDQFEQQLNFEIDASSLAAPKQTDSYHHSGSAAIEIETKRGDTVTNHLDTEQRGNSNRVNINNGRSAAMVYEAIQNNSA